jgi:Subtilase family
LAYLRFQRGAISALDELRSAGAQAVGASARYQTVTVATKPSQLQGLARVPGVVGVTPVLAPVTAATTCTAGSVVSEGDTQLRADAARLGPPSVDGSGVTVGILSDSFDQATEAADGSGPIATDAEKDVESGDLPGGIDCPTPVDVASNEINAAEATDEGRAMAQVVHDLAPGAELAFASAFNGEPAFAESIEKLAEAEADVLVDDVFYLEEPFFQDGPVAVAASKAIAEGVSYISAAGNDNLIDAEGHDIASWETPAYRDAGSCPPEVEAIPGGKGEHCLDFDPGSKVDKTFGIKVEAGETLTVDLQWDEAWNGVGTDIDSFLLNASGGLVKESIEDNVHTSQMPVEVIDWTNASSTAKTVQLVANRFAGSDSPAVKFALVENGRGVEATEYPRSSTGADTVGPTIFGHSGSASVISAGAVYFGDSSKPEKYSSRGPVVHDFGPVEGATAAEPLPARETISKPDLVATDCGRTTFFARFFLAAWRFCGTSAAAPHAAAVAALMLEAKPTAAPDKIRAALLSSATGIAGFDACAVGAGLVEAVAAVEEVLNPGAATEPECESPEPEVDPDEAAAAGDWGSETPPAPPGSTTKTPAAVIPVPTTPHSKAPRTFFRQHPSKIVHTRHRRARVVFRFGSNEAGVSYACRIDGGLFRACPMLFVQRFPIGRHTVRVAARDAEGNGDKTPAVYRFRVERAGL